MSEDKFNDDMSGMTMTGLLDMSAPSNGGPAFPSSNDVRVGDFGTSGHAGMTLRDYLAAKAMQSFCCGSDVAEFITKGCNSDAEADLKIAQAAYGVADAMLAARGAQ